MRTHTIKVSGRRVTCDDPFLVQNTVNEDRIVLNLDEEWDGLDLDVYVEGSGTTISPAKQDDGSYIVPWECLLETGRVSVGVVGKSSDGKTTLRHQVMSAELTVARSMDVDGAAAPSDPTVTELDQLVSEARGIAAAEQGRVTAENARVSAESKRASEWATIKLAAEQATEDANEATEAANTAASAANTAASSASSAASDASEAADEARAAAGMISQDKTIFMGYDTVGGVAYLTLTDEGDD